MEKGIKESKELIIGGFGLAGLFIKHFMDGLDPMDPVKIFMAIQNDPKYKEAVEGLKHVPGEAQDYSVDEIFELGMLSINEAKNLVMQILGKK